MKRSLLALAAAVIGAPVFAQTDNVFPQRFERIWGGNNGSGTGIAANTGRSQYLFTAPFAVGTNVLGLGWRRAATTTNAAFTVEVEAAVSSTTADNATLATSWGSNIGGDNTVIVPRAFYNVPAFGPNASPADFARFPANQPWPFAGPNLLIDITTFSSTRSSPFMRLDRCFANANGESVTFGAGCGTGSIDTANSQSFLPGTPFDVTLSGAAPNQPAFLLAGGDLSFFAGGVPLPFDLGSSLGMTGCDLLLDPIATSSTATGVAGDAALTLTIPNTPTIGSIGLAFQWFYVDPAAAGGARVSDGELVNIGPRTCPNRYVFSFSSGSSTGSLLDGGPITLVVTQ